MTDKPSIAIVLFARKPEPGKVKSRLAATIGPDAACEIYSAMANDIWRTMQSTGLPCILSSNTEDEWLPKPYKIILQPNGSFGEIIRSVLGTVNEIGFDAVIALGADTPHLSPSIIQQAIDELTAGTELITSPSDDGGLVLLGVALPSPVDFSTMPFESASLDQAMVVEGRELKFKRLLPGSYDIDTIDDVKRLLNEGEPIRAICPDTIAAALETGGF
jgi:glycosyltransferase A (GT-A) superfamily protein (DUF2064 family)